ncbi:hypothetical protein BS78_K133700 [Paspalum vaginatum]|uniref:Uncharacterized protein n=1 Tax=Paspalum vaginatum TaxID=158149 RepID=A0A9W8CDD0_9POAL|nr:hypothetical protein BS78_K133700 [Paspalum vaginatum]
MICLHICLWLYARWQWSSLVCLRFKHKKMETTRSSIVLNADEYTDSFLQIRRAYCLKVGVLVKTSEHEYISK